MSLASRMPKGILNKIERPIWDGACGIQYYSNVERRMSRHEQSSTTRCRVGLEGPVKEGLLSLGKIRQV